MPLLPNIVGLQNLFLGRLYSFDLFTLYRALSGRYYQTPTLLVMGLGLGANQDVAQIGILGPTTRSMWMSDMMEIFYNNRVYNTLSTLPSFPNGDLWNGWNRFTAILQEDADSLGTPYPTFPTQTHKLETLELSPDQVEQLTEKTRFLYHAYRGDVEWTEEIPKLASTFVPEMLAALLLIWGDLKWIFERYTVWVKERIFGAAADNESRIITKSILLSNYRWYTLVGDLLAGVDPAFNTRGFQDGLMQIAEWLRKEAEQIRITVTAATLPSL